MPEVPGKSDAALREERILSWWKERGIFQKSLTKESPKGEFVFYEGPPTANGRPGIHHLEGRAFKDAIPRFKTMRGFHVARRAGWDTHGLPVELEVEKQLGFSGKPEIEKYGIAAFNKKCRESVMTYIEEWSRFTERIGYWVNQEKAYFTFNAPYMESLFSIVKKVNDDGRLYKDYKVLPWCVSCGTALSSHELAQGYEDIRDLSITAKFELVDEPGTFFLAWTTTPWTLPGNVGLAVGNDIDYIKAETVYGTLILAEKLSEKVLKDISHKVVGKMKGSELVGKKYKALYPFAKELAAETEQEKFKNAYQVYPADFVTTEDGTGIVHTAVMYGTEDFELGAKFGLPKVHLIGPDGLFLPGTGFLEGKSVIENETAVEILKDLQEKGVFFSKETYTHSYPHCWRSKNRLIYFARDSWYIRMTDLRETLLAENKKVNWEPSHIRDGRMGEWLANAKDWAISRERYWGTPLPVWENTDGTERVVVGSVKEMKARTKKSGNRYFAMRHGEAQNNVSGMICSDNTATSCALTEFGRAQALRAGAILKDENITKIICSPLFRARDTALAVAEAIGFPADQIIYDDRLQEVQTGEWNGRSVVEYHKRFESSTDFVMHRAEGGGESWPDVRRRVANILYEVEREWNDEGVLFVTHGTPLRMLTALAHDLSIKEYLNDWKFARDPVNAEVRALPFVPVPHNEDYDLDLHRPYIDDVTLIGDSGTHLKRVKEVMDVWFDSGSMPFAQDHYPFENKEWIEGAGYPADFISEGLDQTRGWFYTLLAVGTLMGRGHAYKNVTCLGLLLDAEGKKMSKSKGNVINPWEAMDMYGVDALRFWMYSVNQPGDDKSFDAKTVKEATRALSWLENSAKFYELFKDGGTGTGTEEVIDRWMRTRVHKTILEVETFMDAYQPYSATRALDRLFGDLSQWYVRRIRDRARFGDAAALGTLRFTLKNCALMLAPFSPFLAEDIFQMVREDADPESVHLAHWPTAETPDEKLMQDMETVRRVASEALMLRQKAGIKVRQPLASFSTPLIPEMQELRDLLKDEINVKEILSTDGESSFDTTLTPELIAEGDQRTFERAVAEARKEMNLSPKDTVTVTKGEGPYSAELSTGVVKFSVTRNAA